MTIKRAGAWEQLSRCHAGIEGLRIAALRPLVEQTYFTAAQMPLARRELARKCRIYAAGARKHGRSRQATDYERLAEACEARACSSASVCDTVSSTI